MFVVQYSDAVNLIDESTAKTESIADVVNNSDLTPDEFYETFEGGEVVDIIKSQDGSISGIRSNVTNTVSDVSTVENTINSNTGFKSQVNSKATVPVNSTVNANGKINMSTELTHIGGQYITDGKFSLNTLGVAAAAVSTGMMLGKAFDSALYNLNPDFWDAHNMSTLNPETWNTITSDISTDDPWYIRAGAVGVNAMLGIGVDTPTAPNTAQMYLDEETIAYMAAYLQQMNALEGETVTPEVLTPTADYTISSYISATSMIDALYSRTNGYGGLSAPTKQQILNELPQEILQDINNYTALFGYDSGSIPACDMFFIPVSAEYQINDLGQLTSGTSNIYQVRLYYSDTTPHADGFAYISSASYSFNGDYTWMLNGSYSAAGKYGLRGYSAARTAIEGISTQSGATVPDIAGITDLSDVLTALKTQLPELFTDAKAVVQTVVDENGLETQKVYYPVPMPQIDPNALTHPVTNTEIGTQTQTIVDPEVAPDSLLQLITSTILGYPTPTPNAPDTGEGITPAVTPPSGTAGALFAVYNPTQSQVNDFGAWLWSSNFVDQLLKVFSDPMQAIISLHKVFCTPSTGGSQNIHVGYLDSGVSSATVSSQYVDVSCGSVTLSEVFGNVFDYTMTHISIYLPFIGIVKLDTADAMRGTISVTYHVDVLTGACLADVEIVRDMGGGVLYQYSGDCAVHYPLSSGSYMGIISGILSVAGGIAGTVATGGAAAPVLIGAAGAAMNAHTDVARSGGFTGNAGAMGSKIPYIIISRPQTAIASNYLEYEGVGSNQTVLLSSCSGYVKIKEVQLKNIPALDTELDMIRGYLLEGVII